MNKLFKGVVSLALSGVIVAGFTGCSFVDGFKEGFKEAYNEASNKTDKEDKKEESGKVLKSEDGKIQVSLPDDWKEDNELNQIAAIQASNRLKEKYIVVIAESTEDFTEDIKLDDYANAVKGNMEQIVKDAEITDFTSTDINGLPAKVFEVGGEVQNVKVRYYIATVKGDKHLYQVMSWTLTSKYDANIKEMKSAVQSFKEVK